jgi:hypothetical protein
MSFTPKAVILLGPLANYMAPLLYENKSYLCLADTYDVKQFLPAATYGDCSGGDDWPVAYLGNKSGLGRMYLEDTDTLGGFHIPLLAEKRVVTSDTLEVWAMNGDIPAGCEPLSTDTFVSPYTTHYGAHPTACGIETGDYCFIRDDFYPTPHKSYIDFYRIHDGVESGRVSAIQSFVYDSMTIPPYRTFFCFILDGYSFTWKSLHDPSEGETAYIVVQLSTSSSFNVSAEYATAETYAMTYVTDHYEAETWLKAASPRVCYVRAKRQDVNTATGVVVHESAWSVTLTITAAERTDELMLDTTADIVPYYCDRVYEVEKQGHLWMIITMGRGSEQDQSPDCVRIQVSAVSNFSTIQSQSVQTLAFGIDGVNTADLSMGASLDYPTVYYGRVRYESSDGLTVGPWSNVYELDAGNEGADAIYNTNYYTMQGYSWPLYPGLTYILTKDTHWTGDMSRYGIASEAWYKNSHTYVLLYKLRLVWETNMGTRDHAYSSLWLADYDGSAVTLTQIGAEVLEWYFDGYPIHNDIVEFGGKVYAGWYEVADDTASLYDWCEITGGVVGTIHHVAIPVESTYCNWATMAVIYADLRISWALPTSCRKTQR